MKKLLVFILAAVASAHAWSASCGDFGSSVAESNGLISKYSAGSTTYQTLNPASYPLNIAIVGTAGISHEGFCVNYLAAGNGNESLYHPGPGCSTLWAEYECDTWNPWTPNHDDETIYEATQAWSASSGVVYFVHRRTGIPIGWEDWMKNHKPADYNAWKQASANGGSMSVTFDPSMWSSAPGAAGTPLYEAVTGLQTGMSSGFNSLGDQITGALPGIAGTSLRDVNNSLTELKGGMADNHSDNQQMITELGAIKDAINNSGATGGGATATGIADAVGEKLTGLFTPSEASVNSLEANLDALKNVPPWGYIAQIKTELEAPASEAPALSWTIDAPAFPQPVVIDANTQMAQGWYSNVRHILSILFWVGFAFWVIRYMTPKVTVA